MELTHVAIGAAAAVTAGPMGGFPVVAAPPTAGSNPGWISLGSAFIALLAAVLGLGQYLRFRTRREKQEAVGRAFSEVLRGLGSKSEVERLASAALTRRLFDRDSEFGAGGLPYAGDAVRVVSAVLRSEPTGTTQKLLADGLRWAPSLAYGDFQRANLRECYWGAGATGTPLDAHGADFYGADLSSASLRRAILRKAVFREAQLLRTVLDGSDCREADFRGADIRGASFNGALLLDAMFDDVHRLPTVISENLVDGRYRSPDPLPTTTDLTQQAAAEHRVFISAPSHLDRVDQIALDQVLMGLKGVGFEAVRLLPQAYGRSAPMSDVAKKIRSCGAVVIFGPPQFVSVSPADDAPAITPQPIAMSTPWNHIEAGIAVGLDKPLLVLRQGAQGGVFDIPDHPEMITVLDMTGPGSLAALSERISAWVRAWNPNPQNIE
jgi:hypothetical protein